ncbi:unnamed protein product [Owenia fusiformis]|uniref:Uncharacterized protein n=1 Tax=Owenia fusiformis TaxID=6347 RepID=A0A8J1XGX1_OWEFU|nr:unnamed protein product [Owenia fusiformis]
MAASAKMSHNHYKNGNYGTLSQNMGKDMDITQDMHLKMSKKIAQLTKVIYALNTKNDEHDAILQNTKKQHEEEIQQLLAETKDKVSLYKNKIGSEVEHKRRIEALEQTLADHEKQKKQYLGEFEDYKKQTEEREIQLKTEHSQNVLALSKDILAAKRTFEDQLKKFDDVRAEFERDKQNALDDLRKAHHREIEELMKTQRNQQGDIEGAQKQLEEKYFKEIEDLKTQCDQLNTDKKTISEEYESKLSKAQTFYEKELQALKDGQNASAEEKIRTLTTQIETMKKDLSFNQVQYKKRVDDLIGQLSSSEDESAKYKAELEKLQSLLKNQNSESGNLAKQLAQAQAEAATALEKLRQLEPELIGLQERCKEQAAEMLKRSTLFGELEATKIQNEATIKDLMSELNKLRDKVSWLEQERSSLSDLSQTQISESSNKLKALEQALEDMSIEKQTMKEKLERDLMNVEERGKQHEKQLIMDHQTSVETQSKQHMNELQVLVQESSLKYEQLKNDLQGQLESERSRHSHERDSIKAEYDQMKAQLTSDLTTAQDEVVRLQKLVDDSKKGLGSASDHINSLQAMSDKMRAELDKTKSDLITKKNEATSFKSELEKLQKLHQKQMLESQEELKEKLEKLANNLEEKWSDTLRKECMKLRMELTEQKEEDKRAAMSQLTLMKEEEMNAIKKGWQAKVNDLVHQISVLKHSLESKQSESSAELDRLKNEAEMENKRLSEEILASAEEYAKKIETLEKMHNEELAKWKEKSRQELKDLEHNLKSKQIEDMQALMISHKSSLEMTKEQAERARVKDLEDIEHKHKEEMSALRSELGEKYAMDLDQHNKAHKTQMQAARMELDRAIEITKQKESEHQMKSEELQQEIRHRERHITSLEGDVNSLQIGLDKMSHELDAKGKEILQIRSEANHQLRLCEEEMRFEHQRDLDDKAAEHIHETQTMLSEFNEAQEMLKDKISALQIMLEEAEDRYRNRESRDEDVEAIQQLKQALLDKHNEMKKLIDDKKYFQMELMNRETNFNKVFTAEPNVGVLNPLSVKRKKGNKGGSTKYTSSAPMLNNVGGATRLNPLPGSPVHDEKLNPHGPLPPMTKKFVK